MDKKSGKLELWQGRLADSDKDFAPEVAKMDDREALYQGSRKLKPLVKGDTNCGCEESSHVRNIIFENIESQISSTIPPVRVTPRRKKDEDLARKIEHFLRNEVDRLPFELINDMAERTVPIQGGVGFLVDWDNTKRTAYSVGELDVSVIHPKQFAPQPGVFTGVRDMDWFIVKVPTTKEAVRRRYGKSVHDESEAEPEIRSSEASTATDAVTMYVGYAINNSGHIDKYAWVNDVELEDLENYQARRQPVCQECGRVKPVPGELIDADVAADPAPEALDTVVAGHALAARLAGREMGLEDVTLPEMVVVGKPEPKKYDGGSCPWCGCEKFTSKVQEFEEIMLPVRTAAGNQISGATPGTDAEGEPVLTPTLVPYYIPDMMPVVIQRSVSVYGQLLGNSDVDAIADQQNTTNRLSQKIIDRLMDAGSRVTLPADEALRLDGKDGKVWRVKPDQKQCIDVYTFSGDLNYELAYLSQVYEESRQILGITDSFQGRRDPTATSGVAKEVSAAQAAGRLESKRVLKNAAYAEIYERMFKNALAYSDEPRPISYRNEKGETVYEEFDRLDFLEQTADGDWVWNDQFLFSCDNASGLASNREAMWQELRLNFQSGAFGDPTQTQTQILFWTKMEEQHYPGAGQTKQNLEDRLQQEREQSMQMAQLQMQQQAAQAAQQTANSQAPAILT